MASTASGTMRSRARRGERVTAGVGKCSVCGLERAAWIDRQASVKLCEHCYSRETRSMSSRGVRIK